jgi:hypothetical protein
MTLHATHGPRQQRAFGLSPFVMPCSPWGEWIPILAWIDVLCLMCGVACVSVCV